MRPNALARRRVEVSALVAVVSVAVLLASAPAAGQSLTFSAPTDRQHIDLGVEPLFPAAPVLTKSVTFTFAVTGAAPTDRIRLVVDAAPPVTFPVGPYTLAGLGPGAHYATAWLVDEAGRERRRADGAPVVHVIRFYLARVCDNLPGSTDCADGDPCTAAVCHGNAPNTGAWYGACRFSDTLGDADCCVTSEWCRLRGQTLDDYGLAYQCADTDADGIGDCVPCTDAAQCQALIDHEIAYQGGTCKTEPTCTAEPRCEFERLPVGCTSAVAACSDGNACTQDTCRDECWCEHTPIEGCCLPGEDDLAPGAPDYGCTPADADVCTHHACVASVCRAAQKYAGCCDADTDCTDPTRLSSCTDPDGTGHGTCADSGADPRFPGAGVCAYPTRDPLCCTRHYECADRYPEELGVCADQPGQDWDRCEYQPNPEYCRSPVDTVVITEIMVDPSGTPPFEVLDAYGEWFEVFNPTDHAIDMEGWTVHDLGEGAARESFTIDNFGYFNVPAGGTRTFAADDGYFHAGGIMGAYIFPPWFTLANGADAIVLRDRDGVLQDMVAYDETWPWAENASMALVSPYLDNADPASWQTSRTVYGNPVHDLRGTPRSVNLDVFDPALTDGLTCDDGDPRTLDVCNREVADICSHPRLWDACLADFECDDLDHCTADSCGSDHRCRHTPSDGCCLTDADCAAWYPDFVTTEAARQAFDRCAERACLAGACRYGRDRSRPGCCVSTTAPELGCADRNVCTVDACVPDGGQDAQGVTYPQCRFEVDPNEDGVVDCCRVNTDCEDGDPETLNRCDDSDEPPGPGQHRCWYPPDPDWCGPGAADPTCDDGEITTDDVCCTGPGAPAPECLAADRCVHVRNPARCGADRDCVDGRECTIDTCVANVCQHAEVPAGCCETHADCNGPDKPPEMYCRTGYCIGRVCRYGAPISGCCVTAADCGRAPCDTWQCQNHVCLPQPVPGCCVADADCPPAADPCQSNVCLGGQCTTIDLPGCCSPTGMGPDPLACGDGDACTSDWCIGGRCRHYRTGGAGCCNTDAQCPDDGDPCTAELCAANVCTLAPLADCRAACDYRVSFGAGHSVYASQTGGLADRGWRTEDRGPGPAAASWGLSTRGAIGPDPFLAFRPTTRTAYFEACAVAPLFDPGSAEHVTLAFDWAADWNFGVATLAVSASRGSGGQPQVVWSETLAADRAPTHVNVPLPAALLDGPPLQVAFCVQGGTTAALSEVALDEVTLACGRAPDLATPANRAAARGQVKTIVDAFTITDPDAPDAITLRFLARPGPWLSIGPPRRVGDGTVWKADLRIDGAVCPTLAPYNYLLRVQASDGVLEDSEAFVLGLSGCP